MLTAFLKVLGWVIARAPESALKVLTLVLGEAVLLFAPGRRRLIFSNLHHAFPGRSPEWRRRIARQSSQAMIETALLSLATPHLGEARIRRLARLAPSAEAWVWQLHAGPARPTVLATLHLALWETQTWLKLLSPVPLPEFGIIFRPLNHSSADRYVKASRERFGMRLLSRKEGFAGALRILRDGGCVGVLFDQNAGERGALTTLFGRVCSSTELPGILAARFGADVRTFYPRRTGFWRVEFECEAIAHDGDPAEITIALNRWLEGALENEALCAAWLWAHDRWRHQDIPARRLRLESRRDLLDDDRRARGWEALPRRTRIWVRLPNWLGDVAMALPLLRALRRSRPDAEITVVAKEALLPLLAGWAVADHLHSLPRRGAGYFRHFWGIRRKYPDVWILFTQSFRGDLEARLAGAPQRIGIVRPGKPRPFLTHAYRLPPGFDESRSHQLDLWEAFLRHFGLAYAPDRSPLPGVRPVSGPVGLIPGSENNPEKRWPISHWRRIIDALPGERFVLFGTAGDSPLTAAVAAGFPSGRIVDLAGKTDLNAYARELRSCRLLVTNDTGGMHLANALGVPLIALFGPTNPLRTGPVFDAPHRIVQPPGCPDSGGAPLAGLAPETVIALISS